MLDLTPERIVRLEPDAVVLLDQRRLPSEEIELRCRSAGEVAEAIRTLAIRGAPAIGVAAAYGLALAAEHGEDLDAAYDALVSSRPTAVNLRWALDELRADPGRSAPERCTTTRSNAVAEWGSMQWSSSLRPRGPHALQHGWARDRRLWNGSVRSGRLGRRARRARLG